MKSYIFVLFFLLTLSITAQTCFPNCKTCDPGPNSTVSCSACNDRFALSSTACSPCSPNCNACTTSGCTSCDGGTYLSSSSCIGCSGSFCSLCPGNVCTACSSNYGFIIPTIQCSLCTVSSCIECFSNHLICNACSLGNGVTPINTCEPCNLSHCQQCSRNFTICTFCEFGYGVVNPGNLNASYDYSCYPCDVQGCKNCSINFKQCTLCIDGMFQSGGKCHNCNDSLNNCSICSDANTCLQCDEYYGRSNNHCKHCSTQNCLTCNPKNNKICFDCLEKFYLQSSDCRPCMQHCLECSSQHNCTLCQQIYYFNEHNKTCNHCPQNCQDCFYNVNLTSAECTVCYTNYSLTGDSPNRCVDTCGDSITIELQCDNEINVMYDGCNENCQIEYGFLCKVENLSTVCSYSLPIQFQVIQTHTLKFQNRVQIKINPSPPLDIFRTSDMSIFFKVTDSRFQIASSSFNPTQKSIILTIDFTENSLNSNLQILFIPDKSYDERYIWLVNSTSTIKTSYLYYQKQYSLSIAQHLNKLCLFLIILGWTCVLIGIIVKSLSGIQLAVTLQISWASLFWFDGILFTAFSQTYSLRYMNNVNIPFFDFPNHDYGYVQQSVSLAISSNLSSTYPHFSAFEIQSGMFANNFNLSMIFQIIPLIIYVICGIVVMVYRCSIRRILIKHNNEIPYSDEYEESDFSKEKKKMGKFQKVKEIGAQIFFCFCIISIVNFVNCILLQFKFESQSINQYNLIFIVIAATLYLLALAFFFFDPDSFGYFRYSFKKSRFLMAHYYIYIIIIVSTVLMLGLYSEISWAAVIPFASFTIYTAIVRPFKDYRKNIHSVFTSLITTFVLSFRVFEQFCPNSQNSFYEYIYFFIAFLALFLLTIATFLFLLYQAIQIFYLLPKIKMTNKEQVLDQIDNMIINQKMKKVREENSAFKALLRNEMSVLNFSNSISAQAFHRENNNQDLFDNENIEQAGVSRGIRNNWKQDCEDGKKLRKKMQNDKIEKKTKINDMIYQNQIIHENDMQGYEQQAQRINKNIDDNLQTYIRNKMREQNNTNDLSNLTKQELDQHHKRAYALELAIEQNDYLKLKNAQQYTRQQNKIKNKDEQLFINAYDQI